MTNTEIEAFLTIVKCGTISAAAQKLFITQPALSRRVHALEQELGCTLFERQKGMREIRLTAEGEAFLALAGRWQRLWQELASVSERGRQQRLNLAAVGSVSSYIFPDVFPGFLAENPDWHLTFHQYHTSEAYAQVEAGMTDLAFVSDQRYARAVRIFPAFSEKFVLAGGGEMVANVPEGGALSAAELDPAREIRLPWNDDFDRWHARHFPENIYPHVDLDQMSLMEEFLTGDNWAVVPISVAHKLSARHIPVRGLKDGPPRRIIWFLIQAENENPLIGRFLCRLDAALRRIPQLESRLAEFARIDGD